MSCRELDKIKAVLQVLPRTGCDCRYGGILQNVQAVVWLQAYGVAEWMIEDDYLVALEYEGSPDYATVLVPTGDNRPAYSRVEAVADQFILGSTLNAPSFPQPDHLLIGRTGVGRGVRRGGVSLGEVQIHLSEPTYKAILSYLESRGISIADTERWTTRTDFLVNTWEITDPHILAMVRADIEGRGWHRYGLYWDLALFYEERDIPSHTLPNSQSSSCVQAYLIPTALWHAYRVCAERGVKVFPLIGMAGYNQYTLNGPLDAPCLGDNEAHISADFPHAKIAASAFYRGTPEITGSIRLDHPLPPEWVSLAVGACETACNGQSDFDYDEAVAYTAYAIREHCPILTMTNEGTLRYYRVRLDRDTKRNRSIPVFIQVDKLNRVTGIAGERIVAPQNGLCCHCAAVVGESLLIECDRCGQRFCGGLCLEDHDCSEDDEESLEPNNLPF